MSRGRVRIAGDPFFEVLVFSLPVMTGILISESRYGGLQIEVVAPFAALGGAAVVAWRVAARRLRPRETEERVT